jgi:hypothetical protein
MIWHARIRRDAARQLNAIPPDRRINDIDELVEDSFRGLAKPLKGNEHAASFTVRGRARLS